MLAGRRYGREQIRLTAATLIGTGVPAPLLRDPRQGRHRLEARPAGEQARVLVLVDRAGRRYRCSCPRSSPTAGGPRRSWPPPRERGRSARSRSSCCPGPASAPRRCTPSRGSRSRWPCSPSRGFQMLGWGRLPRAGADRRGPGGAVHDPDHGQGAGDRAQPGRARREATRTSSRRDERSALDYLADDKEPGSVITQPYLGVDVPGRTGRRTYVGNCLWSEPNCPGRATISRALFNGNLTPASARSFVRAQRRPVPAGRLHDHARTCARCSARSSARRTASAARRYMRLSSRIVRLHCALAGPRRHAGGLSVAGCGAAEPQPVSVFPIPGARVAAPQTQITFRGVTRGHLGTRDRHRLAAPVATPAGSLSDSDGDGASFLPAKPFAPGEMVTVDDEAATSAAPAPARSISRSPTRRERSRSCRWIPADRVPGDELTFHSRPDLTPPAVEVTRQTRRRRARRHLHHAAAGTHPERRDDPERRAAP